MNTTGFTSTIINKKDVADLQGVTSLTISNYGPTELAITINGISRPIPAFNSTIGLPFTFDIPGDGTAFDVRISFEFKAGVGSKAILDYRKIKEC